VGSEPGQAGVVVGEDDRQHHAVGTVQHAAVAGDDPAGVLGVVGALDHRLGQVAELGNLNAITDAGTGAELALAAMRGAALNVRINLNSLQDQATAQTLRLELEAQERRAETLIQEIHTILCQRSNL